MMERRETQRLTLRLEAVSPLQLRAHLGREQLLSLT
jgi:hypothetical protein